MADEHATLSLVAVQSGQGRLTEPNVRIVRVLNLSFEKGFIRKLEIGVEEVE